MKMADEERQTGQFKYNELVRALRKKEANVIDSEEMIIRLEENPEVGLDLYRSLFRSLDVPLGLCRILCNEGGQPCDFRPLEVNEAFERLMRIPSADPAPGKAPPDLKKFWIETYGRIALSRHPARFRHFIPALDRWFEIVTLWLSRDVFACLFVDITESQELRRQLGEMPPQQAAPRPQAHEDMEERVLARTQELSARNRELEQRTGLLRRLTQELAQAEQRERKRLSSLLHDHLQQLLVAAKFSTEGLKSDLKDSDHLQNIQEIYGLINESIQATKSLTMELCPPVLHEMGLGAGLGWLAHWMHEKHGLQVHLDLRQLEEPQATEIRILLFESIRELLFNVVKHAQVKEAFIEGAACGPERLQIIIRDEGAGFDPARLQGDTERTNGGFGLFSIRQRLGLIGGRLEIESRPGTGSRFTILSPAREIHPAEPESWTPDDNPPPIEEPEPKRGQNRIRVLVADDHMIMRQGLSLLLNREEDFVVVGEAQDGGQAVELTEQLRPDAIVMDIRMPGMDGIEATRRIRLRMPKVRILAFSNHEERDAIAEVLEAGASAFVHKGRRLETMLTVLRSISLPLEAPAAAPL